MQYFRLPEDFILAEYLTLQGSNPTYFVGFFFPPSVVDSGTLLFWVLMCNTSLLSTGSLPLPQQGKTSVPESQWDFSLSRKKNKIKLKEFSKYYFFFPFFLFFGVSFYYIFFWHLQSLMKQPNTTKLTNKQKGCCFKEGSDRISSIPKWWSWEQDTPVDCFSGQSLQSVVFTQT